MRVHLRDHDGIVASNHSDPVSLARSSGGLCGVLVPDTLAISNRPMSSHDEVAHIAGVAFTDGLKPGDGCNFDLSLRLAILETSISCELWCDEGAECPYSEEVLGSLLQHIQDHPRMRWARRHPDMTMEITIFTDNGPTWQYSSEGLLDLRALAPSL